MSSYVYTEIHVEFNKTNRVWIAHTEQEIDTIELSVYFNVKCMAFILYVIGPRKISLICKIHFIDGCTVLAIDGQICFWATITLSNMKLRNGQAASHETASSGSVV